MATPNAEPPPEHPVFDADGFYPCPKCNGRDIGGECIGPRQWQRYCNNCGFAGGVSTTMLGSKINFNQRVLRSYKMKLRNLAKRRNNQRATGDSK